VAAPDFQQTLQRYGKRCDHFDHLVFRNRSINFRSLIREELGFIWQMRYTYPSAHFEHLQHL